MFDLAVRPFIPRDQLPVLKSTIGVRTARSEASVSRVPPDLLGTLWSKKLVIKVVQDILDRHAAFLNPPYCDDLRTAGWAYMLTALKLAILL